MPKAVKTKEKINWKAQESWDLRNTCFHEIGHAIVAERAYDCDTTVTILRGPRRSLKSKSWFGNLTFIHILATLL